MAKVNYVQDIHERGRLEPGTTNCVQYVAENNQWSNLQWCWLVLFFLFQCTPAIKYSGGKGSCSSIYNPECAKTCACNVIL